MRNISYRITIVIITVIAILAIIGCANGRGSNAPQSDSTVPVTVQQVSMVEAVKAWRNREAVFVDVRTVDEYKQGHVPGAILIPLAEIESRRGEIPTDKKVYLICRSGNRSGQARDLLRAAGLKRTTSVGGGMNAWSAAGLPVVTGN